MEKVALGELNLSVEEFGESTVKEIEALSEGYIRRHEQLEDLFIVWSALPIFQMHLGRKAPTYKSLTEYRRRDKAVPSIEQSRLDMYKSIIEEGENLVKKSRD